MGRLLSGRVGVTSYSGLSTHRNQTNGFPSFLGLEEAEPSLGLPSNNEYILYANTNGKDFGMHHLQVVVVDQHLVSPFKIKVQLQLVLLDLLPH